MKSCCVHTLRPTNINHQVYISGYTDPRTVGVVGAIDSVHQVEKRAKDAGLIVQGISMRGKLHNPENKDLAKDLQDFCESDVMPAMPEASECQVPLRSNITNEIITQGSFLPHILAGLWVQVDWYKIMVNVAEDLKQSAQDSHDILLFALGDCIPKLAFNKTGLKTKKVDVHALVVNTDPVVFTSHSRGNSSQQQSDQTTKRNAEESYPENAIAITGVACRFPGADDFQALWDLISSGKSMAEEIGPSRIDITGCYRNATDGRAKSEKYFANLLSDARGYDHSFFNTSPREAASMDPQQRLLLETSFQALEVSGYTRIMSHASGHDVGVFIGAATSDYLGHTSSHTPNAYMSTGNLKAFLSGKISHFYGWTGPSETIDTACSSSLVAINRACKAIQYGECSMAVAGAVNVLSTADDFLELGRAGFLSRTGQCKPFDASADGYCRAEGVGLIVLKPLSEALKDNSNILGVIGGIGTNQSGMASSITVPYGPAQASLLRKITSDARTSPSQISYMEAHGTGTQVGDPIEISSIREVFGGVQRKSKLHVGSIKGNIGHTEAVAGIAGLIKALLIMQQGMIPPQANFNKLNPAIQPFERDNIAISKLITPFETSCRSICVSSYGAAGSNAALILRASPPRPPCIRDETEGQCFPFLLSARSTKSTAAFARKLLDFISSMGSRICLRDIAFTLAERRQHHSFKASSVQSTTTGLLEFLQNSANLVTKTSTKPKKVIMAFAGQNQRTLQIDKRVYDSFPIFRKHFNQCNESIVRQGFPTLIPAIFEADQAPNVVQLQCSMFALQYASATAWLDCGLHIDCVIGHSFGELTALAVSGILSLDSAARVIGGRALLMQTKWGPETGSMLLLREKADKARNLIQESKLDLEIACHNAARSQVIVGSEADIATFESQLQSRGSDSSVRCQRLDLLYGFHSRLAEPLLPELDRLAHAESFNAPKISFEACTYERADRIYPDHVVKHTRHSVHFQRAVERIEARHGPCLWLEGGFDSQILTMVKAASQSPADSTFLEMKFKDEAEVTAPVSRLTCKLWQEGLQVSHWDFIDQETRRCNPIWLPPYQFDHTDHWLPHVDRAKEALDKLHTTQQATPESKPQSSNDLVLPLGSKQGEWLFQLNRSSPRFQKIVSSHVVLQKPLCPMSIYFEAVAAAATRAFGTTDILPLSFEDVSIEAPLLLESNSKVSLCLKSDATRRGLSFQFETTSQSKDTVFARGRVNISEPSRLDSQKQFCQMQRLLHSRFKDVQENPEAESLRSGKLYQLFSRVANYSEHLRCLQSFTSVGNEAVAKTCTPPASVSGTIHSKVCDSVVLDGIMQALGLLMNSGEWCSHEEALTPVGLDSLQLSAECQLEGAKNWIAYAIGDATSSAFKGDLFAFDECGSLQLIAYGILFHKIKLSRFAKALELASSRGSKNVAKEVANEYTAAASHTKTENLRMPDLAFELLGPSSQPSTAAPASKASRQQLTEVVMSDLCRVLGEFVGIEPSEISQDATIGDLGVDSLASVELADELATKFSLTIDGDSIHGYTVRSLLDMTKCSYSPRLPEPFKDSALPTPEPSTIGSFSPKVDPLGSKFDECNSRKVSRASMQKIVSDVCGVNISEYSPETSLGELGLDSLSLVELDADLEREFGVHISEQVETTSTVKDLITIVERDKPGRDDKVVELCDNGSTGLSSPPHSAPAESANGNFSTPSVVISPTGCEQITTHKPVSMEYFDPAEALLSCKDRYESYANSRGFKGYWLNVAPQQDHLVCRFIIDAFKTFDVNLEALQPGTTIPALNFNGKHSQLIHRLWTILQENGYVEKTGLDLVRGPQAVSTQPRNELARQLNRDFPDYSDENNLFCTAGSRLAECLAGRVDPVRLILRDPQMMEYLNKVYGVSPQVAAATDLLLDFLKPLQSRSTKSCLRILEIGAGSGGTTTRLAEALSRSDSQVSYTFTDVSPTLVRTAQKKYSQYQWMNFQTLDVTKDPPSSLHGTYDLVVATNVMHATPDTIASLENTKTLLKDHGFLALIEVTKIHAWYDLVFGLLEGWWCFRDHREYSLQSSSSWIRDLSRAGFSNCAASDGTSLESQSQAIIIGTKTPAPRVEFKMAKMNQCCDKTTVPYKTVDDRPILADIYFPRDPPSQQARPVGKL